MTSECVIYQPLVIDETVIVSGPPDAEAQVFNGTGPYDDGDEVWDGGHVFRSKVASNTDDTSTLASWEDLGEVDNGADAWTAGSYAEGVWKVWNHRVYKSAVSSNTTEPGDTENPDDWTDYGPTNRYRAFDENLARFSTSKGSLKWVLEFPDTVMHCTLFSPIGTSVNLAKVADGATIYDEEKHLFLDGDVNIWGYFFTEPTHRFNALISDMVSVPGEQITLEISSEDATATVGAAGLHFGSGVEVGIVVVGGTGLEAKGLVSIEFDDFGNRISPVRPKQQISRFATQLSISEGARVNNELNSYSQLPCIAFMRGGEDFGLLAWGVLDDHVLDMPHTVISELAIKIKGFPQ